MIATRALNQIDPDAGERLPTPAGLVTVMLAAEETDYAYAVMLMAVPPQDAPLPLHQHPFVESFYVLSEGFEFSTIGERGVETLRPSVGALLHVPPDAPHTIRNAGRIPGKLLAVGSPTLVRFVREMSAETVPGQPPDMARLNPIFKKYGMRVVEAPTE